MATRVGNKVDRVAERRTRVMEAARGLFVSRGFHAASTAQIAEAAGIAVQQMYRDFGSKEGIVSAIVEKDISGLFTAIDSAVAMAGQSQKGLSLWLNDLLSRIVEPESGDLRAEIFAEAQRNENIAALLAKIEQRIREAIATVVSAYSGSGKQPEEVALLTEIILLLTSTGNTHWRTTLQVPTQDIVTRLATILEREITEPQS